MAQSLFTMATTGRNVAAAIFSMKARAGWREKHDLPVDLDPVARLTDAELEAELRKYQEPQSEWRSRLRAPVVDAVVVPTDAQDGSE